MRPVTITALCLLAAFGAPAWADREAGRKVFHSTGCIACHSIECNRIGPMLGDIMGRRAGSALDYARYSDAMKTSGIIWTEKTLDAYLADPAAMVPGNTMVSFAGKLEDEKQRRDLIDFLKQPDASLDFCF